MTLPDQLAGVIRFAIREALFDARTFVPARVEAWAPNEQTIDAQPLIRRVRVVDGERLVDDYPVITRIPVSFLRWGGFVIRCPLKKGDVVTLAVSDRELERWLASDGIKTVEPRGRRIHSINDAVAMPGLSPWSDPIPNLADGELVIGLEDGSGEMRIKADGALELGSKDAEKKGVARLDDETTSDSSTDSAFWTMIAAVDTLCRGLAPLTGPLQALGTLGQAYQVAVPPVPGAPTSQTGKITSASGKTSTE